jgi:hypothetical protein
MSLGGVALAYLLNRDGVLASSERPELKPTHYTLDPKTPPKPARARAMISLWMQGGPSHMDLFDPKPALDQYAGQTFPGDVKYDNAAQASAKFFPVRGNSNRAGNAEPNCRNWCLTLPR